MARQEKTFIGNIKSRFLKIQAYLQLDIKRFFDLDARWTDSSPELRDLLEQCKDTAIAKILGHPGKLSPIKNLTRLLKPLGFFLRGEKTRHEEKIIRIYRVDSEQFFKPARLAVLKGVAQRYEDMKLNREELNWDDVVQREVIPSEAEFEFSPEVAETAQNRSFSVARESNLYITNKGSRATLEEDDEATSGETNPEVMAPSLSQVTCDNSQDLEETEQPTFTFEEEVDAIVWVLANEGMISDESYKEELALVRKHHSLEVIRTAILRLSPERREQIENWLRELSPSPLVEKSPEVSSPLPSEKISAGPSNDSSSLGAATLRMAAIAAHFIASRAAKSGKVSEVPPVPAIAQEPAQ
jgi:hypothetical protein